MDAAKIDIINSDLKKQLSLTTEDLRFAEFINKNVMSFDDELFNDSPNWEDSDDWVRFQFKVYLLHLLRTSESNGK